MPRPLLQAATGTLLLVCFGTLAGAAQESASSPAGGEAKVNAPRAEDAYLAGARLLSEGNLAEAQKSFARAAQLAPRRQEYALALAVTREHRVSELVQRAAKARLLGHASEADGLIAEAAGLDPNNVLVRQHTQPQSAVTSSDSAPGHIAIAPAPQPVFAPPISLQPTTASRDLDLRGDPRTLVTQTASAFGIRPVFDASVTSTAGTHFQLSGTTYKEAMPLLLRTLGLFAVPLDTTSILVAKDTEENRQRLERQVEETIYIPGSGTAELNEYINIIKNIFDVSKIVPSPSRGTLTMRAPEPTIRAVNYTLADMLDGGAEVVLETKLVMVSKSLTRNTGLATPTSAGVFSVAAEAQSIVSANQSLVNTAISSGAIVPTGNTTQDILTEAIYLVLSGLATDAKVSNLVALAGNGLSLTGIYVGSYPTLNLALNSSDARALDDITVRVDDGKEADLRIGERYPITVSTYSSGISSSAASALSGVTINGVSASQLVSQYLGAASTTTVPIIQYEDLGITLKTTPNVLKSGLVSVKLDLKVEALTGSSINNIPVLTNSQYVSGITLKDGMTAVMMAELNSAETAAIDGLPGIGELPGFQDTLANANRQKSTSELVLLITPHIVRHRSPNMASRVFLFNNGVPGEN